MLDDKSRVILFWFSIGMIVVVVIVALVTLVQAWGRGISEESPLTISPDEIRLCLGESHEFTVGGIVEDDAELEWRATGGTISASGRFTADFVADDEPGDYVITVIRSNPRQIVDAVVHVAVCTPTPVPSPTPIPTLTPIPSPTPTPTPEPTSVPTDSRGDVGAYESGVPVEGVPPGVDIRSASVGTDLRVDLKSTVGVPEELIGWLAEGEVLLWIVLYEPIPDPPVYTDWLFVLDLDGDIATGRPAGAARINPDLGDEVVVGALYDPTIAEYSPYFLVWDSAEGSWVDGPDGMRFYMGESRTVVGFALPLETLTQAAEGTTGVMFAPEAAKGRAAVLSFAGEQTVVDFYPDRPQ